MLAAERRSATPPHLLTVPTATPMDTADEIIHDVPPFLHVYKSGRVERFIGTEAVPAGVDPASGVSSKDVVVHPETGVSVRLYLPRLAAGPSEEENKKRLPVLVYIHGGGFCIESAFSPNYHGHLNTLVSRANVIAVSVNYRLAPEHPLPAAYDDSWAVLEWLASHAPGGGGTESWLAEHADLGRIFMAGDSAGGNIVHNVAMRAGTAGLLPGVRIERLVLIHPFFWGSDSAGEAVERMWTFVCPSTVGIDDPLINPMAEGAPALKGIAADRVLVCVAAKDFLCEKGRAYYKALKGSGWGGEAELLDFPDEGHVFHLINPGSENASSMVERMVNYLKGE